MVRPEIQLWWVTNSTTHHTRLHHQTTSENAWSSHDLTKINIILQLPSSTVPDPFIPETLKQSANTSMSCWRLNQSQISLIPLSLWGNVTMMRMCIHWKLNLQAAKDIHALQNSEEAFSAPGFIWPLFLTWSLVIIRMRWMKLTKLQQPLSLY